MGVLSREGLNVDRLLTLPESSNTPLSIRAKAFVFHDTASLALLAHVERIACSEASVLVIGETGTGKELIARQIHAISGRRGPFVAVNCGAFSENLIDAELFGHEAGAFTGASQARAGWFEVANGGTLFLDEIGDLPLALQVKLLRVLQERQVVRLGSRRSVELNVRLVAATNIDLVRAIDVQHFRADLYYRLSVATVRLPPLRERPSDILPLAQHFISVYESRLHVSGVTLSRGAEQALLQYSWPGNIRELENAIHYALIVCHNQVIEAADIRLLPLLSGASTATPSHLQPLSEPTPQPLTDDSSTAVLWQRLAAVWRALLEQGDANLYAKLEAEVVQVAFQQAGGNQMRMAKTLGITRNVVRTLLKRHGWLEPSQGATADEEGT